MSSNRTLVLGTRNEKKGAELAQLMGACGFQLRTLPGDRDGIEVAEQADSFGGNARQKASQYARHVGEWVLAEDSGLVVDALGGAPGVFSARYSGPEATDESNNRHLLRQMDRIPLPQRTAQFVCHMAVADRSGLIRAECEAACRGQVRREPAGTAGFGYDPLFEIVEYHRTFAELGETVKSVLSHRARAARLIIPRLLRIASTAEW